MNKFSGQYLIASEKIYDDNRRYIFSLKQSTSDALGNKWRLKYNKTGHYYTLSAQDHHKEYLYLDNYLDKSQTLNVFLTSNTKLIESYSVKAKQWQIIEQKDGYFYIKNLFKKEYLYEFYYDFDTSGHQYVFVSKNTTLWSKLNNDKRKWKIK